MRKLLKSPDTYVLTCLIVIAITGILTFHSETPVYPTTPSTYSIIDHPRSDTAFGGVFFDPSYNTPYSDLKKQYDSLNMIKSRLEFKNSGPFSTAFLGVFGAAEDIPQFDKMLDDTALANFQKHVVDSLDQLTLLIGDATATQKDSLQKIYDRFRKQSQEEYNAAVEGARRKAPKLHYIMLGGYTLKDPESKFFVDNNTYNIAYQVKDSVKYRQSDSVVYYHYERKQVPVRYSSRSNAVLIPISKKQYSILRPFVIGGDIMMAIIWMFLYVFGSIVILINISRGKPFARKNITYLRVMTCLAILYASIKVFFPYLLRQIYSDLIPADFTLPAFGNLLQDAWQPIFTAITIFLLMKAFAKGYRLQQDNSLTI